MIAGPVTPRSVLGLEALLSRHLDLIEHGLVEVARQFEVRDVFAVPVLARDFGGAPVLVFAEAPDAGQPAALRAARAFGYLCANPWLLQRVFPHRMPEPPERALRVVVVGFRIDDVALATLRALALPDLVVCELHEWSIAGARHWCARPLLAKPERDDHGFSPPSAARGEPRALAAEVLQWLERLDADVAIDGDRYARRVHARGRPLCTLAVGPRDVTLALTGGPTFTIASRTDAIAAMDVAMSAFQAVLAEAPADALPLAAADLADLRRSVRGVRLTAAECAALQEDGASA